MPWCQENKPNYNVFYTNDLPTSSLKSIGITYSRGISVEIDASKHKDSSALITKYEISPFSCSMNKDPQEIMYWPKAPEKLSQFLADLSEMGEVASIEATLLECFTTRKTKYAPTASRQVNNNASDSFSFLESLQKGFANRIPPSAEEMLKEYCSLIKVWMSRYNNLLKDPKNTETPYREDSSTPCDAAYKDVISSIERSLKYCAKDHPELLNRVVQFCFEIEAPVHKALDNIRADTPRNPRVLKLDAFNINTVTLPAASAAEILLLDRIEKAIQDVCSVQKATSAQRS